MTTFTQQFGDFLNLINNLNAQKKDTQTTELTELEFPKEPVPEIPKKQLTPYKETLRAPTDLERQILRSALLEAPQGQLSWAKQAANNYVNQKGEEIFKNLSADALKQTVNEYQKALKKEQTFSMLQGLG
ncbi:MAG: hypothetical protein RL675_232, partial [Bacteroidota bacterium]